MKTYLINRLKNLLFILSGAFIGILIAFSYYKNITLNPDKIHLLISVGIGILIGEFIHFVSWFLRRNKN
ncbi:hypothetical protein J5Y03_11570 [Bacillus sp. RG28]|uniref:Uncharacterized protein n=1 Tax=Gottfriedia endophytica TaxID=2820819 RepID=A0A940SJ94_9BACI|nr:hypothetical protein [Gottfriedia endophytica]MBP0725810.1 hypothetical protein [Gottfriedia endophytica]